MLNARELIELNIEAKMNARDACYRKGDAETAGRLQREIDKLRERLKEGQGHERGKQATGARWPKT